MSIEITPDSSVHLSYTSSSKSLMESVCKRGKLETQCQAHYYVYRGKQKWLNLSRFFNFFIHHVSLERKYLSFICRFYFISLYICSPLCYVLWVFNFSIKPTFNHFWMYSVWKKFLNQQNFIEKSLNDKKG